jgi:hypothetical protein
MFSVEKVMIENIININDKVVDKLASRTEGRVNLYIQGK